MAENPVQVDHDELGAEAAAIPLPDGASLPAGEGADQATPAGELVEAPATSWASSTPSVVFLVDRFVCPAWKLTDTEKQDLAGALTPVLDDIFPGGLGSERWAPYVRLLTVAGSIVVTRIDEHGKIKPLRESKADAPARELDDEGGPRPFTTAAGAGSH